LYASSRHIGQLNGFPSSAIATAPDHLSIQTKSPTISPSSHTTNHITFLSREFTTLFQKNEKNEKNLECGVSSGYPNVNNLLFSLLKSSDLILREFYEILTQWWKKRDWKLTSRGGSGAGAVRICD
jgi:hypothetical protein